jgi:hypothetical protein
MSEEYLAQKARLHSEIEAVRSKAGQEPKLRTRAQERVYELLEEALKFLEEEKTPLGLHRAASRIQLAQKRIQEAMGQSDRLVWLLFTYLSVMLFFAAGAILVWALWPATVETPISQVLLGTVCWGTVGASIDGLRELHTRFARQELDINRRYWYVAHPVIGAGLGGIVFLLVLAGLLSTGQTGVLSQADNGGGFNGTLPFLIAALVGFEEETVIRYLRTTVRQIFRVEDSTPMEGG